MIKNYNEIEVKLGELEQKRNDLSNEKALLTKELIDEREEDLSFEENEIPNIKENRILSPWEDYGKFIGFITEDYWIDNLYKGLEYSAIKGI